MPLYLPSILSSFLSFWRTSAGRFGSCARAAVDSDPVRALDVVPAGFSGAVFVAAGFSSPSPLESLSFSLSFSLSSLSFSFRAPRGSSVTASEGAGVPPRVGVPMEEAGAEVSRSDSNSAGSFSFAPAPAVVVEPVLFDEARGSGRRRDAERVLFPAEGRDDW